MAAEFGHHANRVYISLAGNLHMNGASQMDGAEVPYPDSVTLTPAASTANISLVTIQFLDGKGNVLSAPIAFDWWLSDAATGIGLTATTASGAVGAGTSGTDLGVLTTKKATRSITDATGKYILSITDTGKTGFYVAASLPNSGKVTVSAQLVAGNYG